MNWVEGPQTLPVGFAIATLIVSFVLFVYVVVVDVVVIIVLTGSFDGWQTCLFY